MTIHYSRNAQEEIERYYERYLSNYESGYQQTDLEQRADNYRQIANTLRYLENYLDQTYVKNNRKFIDIGNIAIVEYKITQKEKILVKAIYFNDNQIL